MRRGEIKGGNIYSVTIDYTKYVFLAKSDFEEGKSNYTPYIRIRKHTCDEEYVCFRDHQSESCLTNAFIEAEYKIATEEESLILKQCMECGQLLQREDIDRILTFNKFKSGLIQLEELLNKRLKNEKRRS